MAKHFWADSERGPIELPGNEAAARDALDKMNAGRSPLSAEPRQPLTLQSGDQPPPGLSSYDEGGTVVNFPITLQQADLNRRAMSSALDRGIVNQAAIDQYRRSKGWGSEPAPVLPIGPQAYDEGGDVQSDTSDQTGGIPTPQDESSFATQPVSLGQQISNTAGDIKDQLVKLFNRGNAGGNIDPAQMAGSYELPANIPAIDTIRSYLTGGGAMSAPDYHNAYQANIKAGMDPNVAALKVVSDAAPDFVKQTAVHQAQRKIWDAASNSAVVALEGSYNKDTGEALPARQDLALGMLNHSMPHVTNGYGVTFDDGGSNRIIANVSKLGTDDKTTIKLTQQQLLAWLKSPEAKWDNLMKGGDVLASLQAAVPAPAAPSNMTTTGNYWDPKTGTQVPVGTPAAGAAPTQGQNTTAATPTPVQGGQWQDTNPKKGAWVRDLNTGKMVQTDTTPNVVTMPSGNRLRQNPDGTMTAEDMASAGETTPAFTYKGTATPPAPAGQVNIVRLAAPVGGGRAGRAVGAGVASAQEHGRQSLAIERERQRNRLEIENTRRSAMNQTEATRIQASLDRLYHDAKVKGGDFSSLTLGQDGHVHVVPPHPNENPAITQERGNIIDQVYGNASQGAAPQQKYQEGQIARSPNGPTLIFRGGQWQTMTP